MKLETIKYDENNIPINILKRGLYEDSSPPSYMGEVTEITPEGDAILNGGPGRIKNMGLTKSWIGKIFYKVGPVIENKEKIK